VESELKYRTISEMTSDYTFVVALLPDGSMRREWIAGAFEKITGYNSEELARLLAEFSVVHQEDRARVRNLLLGLREKKPVDSVEFRILSKEGGSIWVDAVAKPLPPSPEGLPRAMIAVKDINDRKIAEEALARRNRELSIVNRIREIFDSGARDGEIMDMILEALLDNSTAVSAGVCRVDHDTGSTEIIAAKNVSEEFLRRYGSSPLLSGTARRILDGDSPMIIQEETDEVTGRSEAMRDVGVYRTIAFPVKVRSGFSAIFLIGYGRESELSREKMRFFDLVRDQARLQFERRGLLADREWHEKKLRELTVSLIGLLEEERNSMALQLHDELGQEIVAINAQILFLENELESCEYCGDKAKETLVTIKARLKELTQNVRKMSYAIHPAVLEDLGLGPALRSYIGKFIESDDLRVDLVTTGFDGKLVGDEALALYRVAQEALRNVVKHSGAGNVTVRVIRGYPDLILTVEDDGAGFSPEGEESRGRGLGLINMRERVEGMGGTFRIISAPGRGTRIRAAIPLEGHDDG
jgi:PAS domain S-box-containing protein